jgi:hypothetical protein
MPPPTDIRRRNRPIAHRNIDIRCPRSGPARSCISMEQPSAGTSRRPMYRRPTSLPTRRSRGLKTRSPRPRFLPRFRPQFRLRHRQHQSRQVRPQLVPCRSRPVRTRSGPHTAPAPRRRHRLLPPRHRIRHPPASGWPRLSRSRNEPGDPAGNGSLGGLSCPVCRMRSGTARVRPRCRHGRTIADAEFLRLCRKAMQVNRNTEGE